MTEERLRSFVEQLNGDDDFRSRFEQDAAVALAEYELSPAEMEAIVATDEDALRRMPGVELPEMRGARSKCLWSWITRHICTWAFCGPPGTRDWQCPKKP
jgi:hypothetical protein